MEADWPPRWELTAPESHVIAYRGGSHGPEAVRLAVVELVARRVLRVEEVERARGLRGSKHEWALVGGPAAGGAVEPPLDVVLELFRSARRREGLDGVLVRDFRRAVRKRFRPLERYADLHVAPRLVERGLLTSSSGRRTGMAPFDWTPAGREADAQLTRWLELARDHLAGWVRSDPVRASAFTREAGSAVLLMSDQYPELEELSRREGAGALEVGGGEAFAAGHPAAAHHAGLGSEGLDLQSVGGMDFGGLLDIGGIGDFGGGGGDGGGGGNGGG